MKTILITGPIGSGKSELSAILAQKGFPVYDSDSRTKALYQAVPGLKQRIETILGIPFAQIGRIFSEPVLREKLEAIVYPLVLGDFEKFREENSGSEAVFMESAVALEKPLFATLFDEVWMVDAPLETRISRNPAAAERDRLQNFDPAKITRTIINGGTIEELKQKINELI